MLKICMKILLINPPRSPENDILKYAPEKAIPFIHKKLIGPPLGLLMVAAAVKDHDVVVFDMKGEYDLDAQAPELPTMVTGLMEKRRPDIVGVTVITSEFNASMEICRVVKNTDPRVLTVAGGLHATLLPEDFTDPSVDVVIPGQAHGIFREMVRAKEKGLSPETVPGLFVRQDGVLRRTSGKPEICDGAGKDFIFPDRSHLRRWIETYKVGTSPHPSTYIFTSLGCPFRCTFCSIWTQFKGSYLQREVEGLITELHSVPEYPVVRFADANTLVDIGFMNTLFDRIMEEGIRKTFVMDIRADVAVKYPHIIEKMAKGGLKVVICGFESFRDKELRRYRKEALATDNQKAIGVFHDNDIMVRGNYMIPDDYTRDDFEALAEYSSGNPVVYAGYTILSPMPGTIYYRQVKHKIVEHDYNKYNFFNAVTRTRLPYEQFHELAGGLWLIKKGTDVI
jgi:radical SAM superfamily enzyme YgiQ (UPF0313 family)